MYHFTWQFVIVVGNVSVCVCPCVSAVLFRDGQFHADNIGWHFAKISHKHKHTESTVVRLVNQKRIAKIENDKNRVICLRFRLP